ncbi:hypothetical protein ACFFF5_11030 [Lederbergia wuyishanensis]|uniref:Glucan phosphoethanolaminetransferase (Alkaline phosphatase superfamily) n=1 Tax=Lederbergia wuyishanensis TaxID=1347903 RepID=A0ABU0D4C8_9BACI|nr:hypothetical protein [Lederbergia wuyishanensis]MCJ8008161.1 hypothetical protein [Lederbergia wuyishanensis]MDQ0343250.1 glucan phosphoethanolaminetransferase (alkaline phosphatase superfamily) [Lederbergia wuyishanensis]
MHPITVIEIIASSIFIGLLFIVAIFLPRRLRKPGIYIASLLTFLLLMFFAARPYIHDYQFAKKKEYLNQYLINQYPNQNWEITRQIGRQYNRNYLLVNFDNERDWTYAYLVKNKKRICQGAWMPPEGKFPDEGKHYEVKDCEYH